MSTATAKTNGKADPASLFEALLAFQANAPHIPLDSENPHFKSKFASLPKIMDLIRPGLTEVGLVWVTRPGTDHDGKPTLRYELTHAATGESIAGEMPLMVTKTDPQGLGAAITYARRYSVLAVLGLVGDADDEKRLLADPPPGNVSQPMSEKARAKVLKAFSDAGIAGDDLNMFLTSTGLDSPEAMTAEHAFKLRELLDERLAGVKSEDVKK